MRIHDVESVRKTDYVIVSWDWLYILVDGKKVESGRLKQEEVESLENRPRNIREQIMIGTTMCISLSICPPLCYFGIKLLGSDLGISETKYP